MSAKSLAIHENETLFGSDNTPGIVAVELKDDSKVEIFRKIKGKSVSETYYFNPFLLLEKPELLKNFKERLERKDISPETRYLTMLPGREKRLRFLKTVN